MILLGVFSHAAWIRSRSGISVHASGGALFMLMRSMDSGLQIKKKNQKGKRPDVTVVDEQHKIQDHLLTPLESARSINDNITV